MNLTNPQDGAEQRQAIENPRPDLAFVFGVQDAITDLGEKLCREFGLRVHLAMKRSDPTQRITSMDDDAVIVPELGEIETVHVCGIKVPTALCEEGGGRIEANWSDDDGTAFSYPLASIVYEAAERSITLPAGWNVRDLPDFPSTTLPISDDLRARQWQEAQCRYNHVGYFGPAGTVVVDFGIGKQLLDIPATYREVFPLIENRHIF